MTRTAISPRLAIRILCKIASILPQALWATCLCGSIKNRSAHANDLQTRHAQINRATLALLEASVDEVWDCLSDLSYEIRAFELKDEQAMLAGSGAGRTLRC